MNTVLRKQIPIAFAVNDNYLKYLSVVIASILNFQRQNEQYFFYILHRDISYEHQEILLKWGGKRKIQIKFINVSQMIDHSLCYVSGYVTEETYYRILVPELLTQWEKVIYMDCDIVCLSNLGDILDEMDKDSNVWLSGTMASRNDSRSDYCREHLGISSDTYIFAGMLLMNVTELRSIGFKERCYDFLREKKWLKQHDMDLINAVCYGHIQILKQCWHTTVGEIAYSKGKSVKEVRVDELDCHMLHYATVKPWKTELCDVTLPYWKYVFESPFSTEIVEAYKNISDTKIHFTCMCEKGEISLGFLASMFLKSIKARINKRK